MLTRGLVASLALSALVGCRYTGTFQCDTDEECQPRGALGTCQLETRLCSVPDADCPSGQRYDASAGDQAGACVEVVVPPPPDAPPSFDPATCPAMFTEVPGLTGSRYVALATERRFSAQMQDCQALAPGIAHAAILDTVAERDALVGLIGGTTHYIGAVQDPMASGVAAGWINADGSPFDVALWAQGEPSDGNGSEADHAQQYAGLEGDGAHDHGDALRRVLCECDGKPVAAMFTAYVQANED